MGHVTLQPDLENPETGECFDTVFILPGEAEKNNSLTVRNPTIDGSRKARPMPEDKDDPECAVKILKFMLDQGWIPKEMWENDSIRFFRKEANAKQKKEVRCNLFSPARLFLNMSNTYLFVSFVGL